MAEDRTVERELLTKYRSELTEAENELVRAQDKVERYRLAVRGLEAVIGPLDASTAPDEPATTDVLRGLQERRRGETGPRGEAAVRRILEQNPFDGFTVRELFEQLQERGWISTDSKNPQAATRAAANRLRHKDRRFVFKDKHFSFEPDPPPGFDLPASQVRRAQPDALDVEPS